MKGEVPMFRQLRRLTVRRARVGVAIASALTITAAAMALTSAGSAVASSTAGAAATHPCGFSAPVGPANPGGIYQTLSAKLKAVYSSDPGALNASPWAHSKPVKGPWKIGYIAFAITNPYNQHVLDGLKSQFAKAKAKGLVSGSLVTNIPATI